MSTKSNTKNNTKNVSKRSSKTKIVSKNRTSSHNLKGGSKTNVNSAVGSYDTDLSRGGREKEFSLLDVPSQHHFVS